MGKYIAKRLLLMIPVILGVILLIFIIMSFTPGDPATIILGSDASMEDILALREKLGLNKPLLVRYFEYVKNLVTKFDFGTSYTNSMPVRNEIMVRFGYTLRVAVMSTCIALTLGIPLGVTAAVNRGSWKDDAAMTVSLLGISVPSFWLGLMMAILFALKLGWLPASGVGGIEYYILPCFSVSFGGIAQMARQTRSSMLEVIRSDYIVTARAKGASERAVTYKHALRNALIPIVTQAGTSFGILLGGALINETIFSIPGLGSYMVTAIKGRDYPAIQGAVVYVAVSFGLVMLAVDILYAFIDPRIRAQYKKGG